jgi:hypothetical protein
MVPGVCWPLIGVTSCGAEGALHDDDDWMT